MKLISEEISNAEILVEETNGKKELQDSWCLFTIRYQK